VVFDVADDAYIDIERQMAAPPRRPAAARPAGTGESPARQRAAGCDSVVQVASAGPAAVAGLFTVSTAPSNVSTAVRRLGRPGPRDVISGLVTGLFSIPEGMAYASIGGFNPVAGLYSGMVPGIIGSLFARTVLMVTTLTSAIALS
jgi:Sulfate permease family